MRWRQILLAAAFAIGAGYVFYRSEGATLTVALAVALLVYAGVRVLIATFYRSLYWLHRDGRRSRECRGCGRQISRRAGDLVTKCHHTIHQHPHDHKPPGECGWIAGWPGTRLLTRSVFTRQFVRSISWQRLGVIALAAVLLFTPVSISAGGAVGGSSGTSAAATGGAATPPPTDSPTATATETRVAASDYTAPHDVNESKVERLVVQYLNEERTNRGRSDLQRRDDLSRVATSYAQTLAEYKSVGHEVGGTTPEQRYQRSGVRCRYSGENAAQTAYATTVDASYGDRHFDNEVELARGLVEQWMHSPPHRENMLSGSHIAVGVGVNLSRQGSTWYVYAVQNFCR
jgi:uncharacterized protein YkwD